ncbi:MAG: ATP-grasp domain-containing protein, partial [Bdellovibrionales bacterium]|nr:ATP-grasp domain-containing protein [Bdellovibrionales bacterium]NQZ19757.1 ATP-grasp domain-containing protein [Bdellovibrionales bacterium]
MAQYQPGQNLGLLGGGQLARMLAHSAQNFGLTASVYSDKADDPAAQVSSSWSKGSIKDEKALTEFLKSVDVATFESEFQDPTVLLSAQKKSNTKILPSPELMGLLQDRKTQKSLVDEFSIATSPWATTDTVDEINSFIKDQKLPVVFKKRKNGYDGYGTYIVKTKNELSQFIKKDFEPNLFIVEKFIPFEKEMAIILARSADGSFTHLPLVESFQKDARCFWVKGPIKMKSIEPMIKGFKKFLKKKDYVGVMGVEFFKTKKGLMVNEIAPRVHNTGHYSMNTLGPSQFDLHNMCLMGQKLPKTIEIKKAFAMVNLLGEGGNTNLEPIPG